MNTTSRRRTAVLAATGLLTAMLGTFAASPANAAPAAPATLSESFTDSTLVAASDWYLSYSGVKPCLTGITSAQSITLSNTTISGCAASADAPGQGALLLSRNTNNNAATMLYNKEISTAAGLDVQFYESQYGGSGADGISFFTKLGTQSDLTVGLPGGGLGYVGVKDGLFGVGFDDWLNWTRWDLNLAPGEQLGGMLCPGHVGEINGYMNSMGIRGPDISAGHDGTSGYCLLNSVELGAAYFGGSTASRQDAARPVRIIVDPSSAPTPKIRAYIWQSGSLGQDIATANFALEADQPLAYKNAATFKFGFAASTGSVTNNHAIWGLAIAPRDVSAATTYYAVPQSETITAGATPAYTLKYYKDAAHTQELTPGGLTKPSCTSAYVVASPVAGSYPITCTGGSVSLAKLQIDGTATLTVTKAPVSIAPAVQTLNATVNSAVTPTAAYVATGFTPTTYTVAPALPAGLSIAAGTGVISGTPTAVSASVTYTVTATNGTDSATATIDIAVGAQTKYAYSVRFDKNGGTGTMADLTGTDSTVKLTANAFVNTNRTFTGWKDEFGNTYTDGQTVTLTKATTLVLYAQWVVTNPVSILPTPQTVTGTVNTAITPTAAYATKNFTRAVTYAIAPALPAGLTFDAATGVVSGTPTAVAATATYTVTATDGIDTAKATIDISIAGQTTYKYGVTFNPNSGVGLMLDQIGEAATVTLRPNAFTRTGFSFAGWKDSQGVAYTDGQTVVLTAPTTLVLTAQWNATSGSGGTNGSGGGAIAYAISFEANGGEGVMAGLTGTGPATVTLTKNAFTSGVMKFVNWRDDAGVTYTDGQSILVSATTSLVLHAQWQFNESNVGSFDKPAPVRPGATQPVSFARNSNALSAMSNAVLRKWNLKTVAAITIAGYVEPSGSSANDFPLSLNRAKSVAKVMAKKYKGLKIKTVGMGRQIAKKCRPFKNKCAYITIMVMKDGRTVKSG